MHIFLCKLKINKEVHFYKKKCNKYVGAPSQYWPHIQGVPRNMTVGEYF